MGTWALEHSDSTRRTLGHTGTWTLGRLRHSDTWSLRALKPLGIWALNALEYSGTWALKALYLADSFCFAKENKTILQVMLKAGSH